VFFDRFFDLPGAFQIHRENDHITRAEADRIITIGYRNFTIDD
jgi:hypothetical protein